MQLPTKCSVSLDKHDNSTIGTTGYKGPTSKERGDGGGREKGKRRKGGGGWVGGYYRQKLKIAAGIHLLREFLCQWKAVLFQANATLS